MAKTFVIINQKGGVGKTTTAINLMAGLCLLKKRVLGVDLDPQGHFSKFIGINTADKKTVVDLLNKTANFNEVIVATKYGAHIPSDNRLSDYLMTLSTRAEGNYALKEALEFVEDIYDYIIIDCPPAINVFTYAALTMADGVIIPTEAEYLSVDGVNMIAETVETIKKYYNPKLKIEGILIVKYNKMRGLTSEVEDYLTEIAKSKFNSKVFSTRIRNTVDVPNSQGHRQSVFEYSPTSNASIDYANLLKELLKQGEKKNG